LFAQNGNRLLIQATNTEVRRDCAGASVRVEATSSRVHLRGDCPSVDVNGSDNSVFIERASSIQVAGNNNRVNYERTAGDMRPAVSVYGRDDEIVQATDTMWPNVADDHGTVATHSTFTRTTTVTGDPDAVRTSLGIPSDYRGLTLAVSGQVLTQSCGGGQDVILAGHDNDVTLTGSCNSIRVDGYGNRVHAQELGTVIYSGHDNTVTWEHPRYGDRPSVSVATGYDNRTYRAY
jgi:hypothetical protein